MIRALSLPFLAVLLALAGRQETSPPAQSVAEAARAARERQKSSAPKHTLTDDDLASRRSNSDSSAGTEAQARAQLESSYSPNPTPADLKSQIDQMTADSKVPAVQLIARYKQTALYGYETVDFPGRQEWEDQLENASEHFIEEAATAAGGLQALLAQNGDALGRSDGETIRRVRAQWIDTVVPYASWQLRAQQLIVDGRSRAKAYLADSAAALREYRRAHVAQAESTVGPTMIELQEAEMAFRKSHDHYTCDLTELPLNAPSDDKLQTSTDWPSRLNTVRGLGYEIVLQGCDADHFTALATPPAADGTQGHAFCSSESATVHIADDGRTANCIATGREWRAQ